MAFTLTQTLSYQTKQYLEGAYNEGDAFKTHVVGRFQLLGTALVGTLEIIVRLALFALGHVAGLFSLYRSPEINQFLQEQIEAGFSACVLTSANFFSLLSPNVFRTAQILQAQEPRIEAAPRDIAEAPRIEAVPINMAGVPRVEAVPINMAGVPRVEVVPINMAGVPRVEAVPINMAGVPRVEVVPINMAGVPRVEVGNAAQPPQEELDRIEVVVEEVPSPREGAAAPVSRRNSFNQIFDIGEQRIVRDIVDCVMLPFQMIAFLFKLPFYMVYLTFHMFVVLPIRFVLLPFEVFLNALNLGNEPEQREPFRLNLI